MRDATLAGPNSGAARGALQEPAVPRPVSRRFSEMVPLGIRGEWPKDCCLVFRWEHLKWPRWNRHALRGRKRLKCSDADGASLPCQLRGNTFCYITTPA